MVETLYVVQVQGSSEDYYRMSMELMKSFQSECIARGYYDVALLVDELLEKQEHLMNTSREVEDLYERIKNSLKEV